VSRKPQLARGFAPVTVNKAKGMICPPFVEFAQTHKRPFPVSLFVVLLHRTHHAEPFK
jgi:hypothetical protein